MKTFATLTTLCLAAFMWAVLVDQNTPLNINPLTGTKGVGYIDYVPFCAILTGLLGALLVQINCLINQSK